MSEPPKKHATYLDVLDAPEHKVAEDIVVPDLGGWRRSRMPTVTSGAFFTLAPDWICEALSPSTERLDRAEKLAI